MFEPPNSNRLKMCYVTGWWLTYPSEKHEFVSWDDDILNIWSFVWKKCCNGYPKSHGSFSFNHAQFLNVGYPRFCTNPHISQISSVPSSTMLNTNVWCQNTIETSRGVITPDFLSSYNQSFSTTWWSLTMIVRYW